PASPPGHAQLCAGPLLVLLPSRTCFWRGGNGLRYFEHVRCSLRVNIFPADRSGRQDGDDITAHLRETAVYEETPGAITAANPQFPITESADQGRAARQDA